MGTKLISFRKLRADQVSLITATVLFVSLAVVLYWRSIPQRQFTQEGLTYDVMWVDFWGLAFFGLMILAWGAIRTPRLRAIYILSALAFFGVVTLAIIFSGTTYSSNGYAGDQMFRIAMLTKFLHVWPPGDYYYKDLPLFYPPLFFGILAVIGKVTSMESYALLKIGTQLVALVLPFVAYWLWRKLVGPTKALLIVIAILLIDAGTVQMLVHVPYAFISNNMFIPWWLYYVEQAHGSENVRWRANLIGGLLGAIIFATYFYPFFVLALIMGLRTLPGICKLSPIAWSAKKALNAWAVLGLSAVFSAPYWFPALLSVIKIGGDRSRGDWFHLGFTGVEMPVLTYPWIGLAFLIGVVYLVLRKKAPIIRGLLFFLMMLVAFFFMGSLLNALTLPVNLAKCKELSWSMIGPVLGLTISILFRLGRGRRLTGAITIVFVIVLTLGVLRGVSTYAGNSPGVVVARKASVSGLASQIHVQPNLKERVLLAKDAELIPFLPIYTFIASNEHYSHPASRFIQRLDMLKLLTTIHDPFVFNTVLRHNRFDAVDYFLPEIKKESLLISISVSNYPNRLAFQRLIFSPSILSDTTLFRLEKPFGWYEVLPGNAEGRALDLKSRTIRESLFVWHNVMLLRDRLSDRGQHDIDECVGKMPYSYASVVHWPKVHAYSDKVSLLGITAFLIADSIHFHATVRANRKMSNNFRVSFHVYQGAFNREMRNFDFSPPTSTSSWQAGDVLTLVRVIPRLGNDIDFEFGFFDQGYIEGPPFIGRLSFH